MLETRSSPALVVDNRLRDTDRSRRLEEEDAVLLALPGSICHLAGACVSLPVGRQARKMVIRNALRRMKRSGKVEYHLGMYRETKP